MTEKQPEPILAVLESAGFEAYYVGGCVRDLRLGRPILTVFPPACSMEP